MKRLALLLSALACLAVLAAWALPTGSRGSAVHRQPHAGVGGDAASSPKAVSRRLTPGDAPGLYSALAGSPIDLSQVPTLADRAAGGADIEAEPDGEPRSERPISPAEQERLLAITRGLAPNPNVQRMDGIHNKAGNGLRLQVTAVGNGIDGSQACRTPTGDPCSVVPSDSQLAVGRRHIVTVVNVAIEVRTKTGTLLTGPTMFRDFFAGVDGCAPKYFDPNVLYDESADRFYLGIDVYNLGYCLAVSATADPTGIWYRYFIPTALDETEFFDFPQAGVGREAIYMGATTFLADGGVRGDIWAFKKSDLYAGKPLTVATATLGAETVPQPANLHGFQQGTWPRSGPHYFITDDVYDGVTSAVWSWNRPFNGGLATREGVLNWDNATGVPAALAPNMPQKGGSMLLADDWRNMDLEYRDGNLWATSTIGCNPGGGPVNCTRWAQFDPVRMKVLNAGVIGGNDLERSYPDLAVDACGNMAVGYSTTNADIFPGLTVTGRRSTDPRGKVRNETEAIAGQVTYVAFDPPPLRWADYSEMTIDPNGKDFYFFGQYAKNITFPRAAWGTYITKLTFNCVPEDQAKGAASGSK